MRRFLGLLLCLVVLTSVCSAGLVQGIDLDLVAVGNTGNSADAATGSLYGAVDYNYNIGTYEVTAGQYSTFLNAVAQEDSYSLYSSSMASSDYGCKITQGGSSGNYSYSIAGDRADRPVNFVSWYDAARFCNYLTSGDTELGVYNTASWAVDRSGAKASYGTIYFLPSENEWYKAGYHKNDGDTANYWLYPTRSNDTPSNDLVDPDPGNNANFYQSGLTIGSPYWTTEVGEFEESESAYGTFDQGGNVWEWNESLTGSDRVLRGGGFYSYDTSLDSSAPGSSSGSFQSYDIGFRIASIPEPCSLVLLGIGSLALVRRRSK